MLQDKDIPVDDERLPDDTLGAVEDEAKSKSLTSQMTDLIDDVRILAHAEVEYYRAKLSVNLAATKRVLVLFLLSIVVGTMTVIALILGMLLILSDYLGPWAATAIVTGSALLITIITMKMAVNRARKLPLDETD